MTLALTVLIAGVILFLIYRTVCTVRYNVRRWRVRRELHALGTVKQWHRDHVSGRRP